MSIGTLPRVEPKHLTFDVAGNLTKDKDAYQYEYDYENRIVKITKNSQTKAEFAYDALATRVEKKDLVDSANTRRYYYNYNWQVLCSYDNAGTLHRWHAFGNYIDELLMRGLNEGVSSVRLFSHDHLYSPVVLLRTTGRVGERYKYDAYGQPTIMDASYNTRQSSIDGNPYLFTGRRLDILDNGSLTIQYSRNRYYDYYTGRFTTHDPLGITPNPPKPNIFVILQRYKDGINPYEYVQNNPVINEDSYGLWCENKCHKSGDRDYKIIGMSVAPSTYDLKQLDILDALMNWDWILDTIELNPNWWVKNQMWDKYRKLMEASSANFVGWTPYLKVQESVCESERCMIFCKRLNWQEKKPYYYSCKGFAGALPSPFDDIYNWSAASAALVPCEQSFYEKWYCGH